MFSSKNLETFALGVATVIAGQWIGRKYLGL